VARWDAAWHRRLDRELVGLTDLSPAHRGAVRRALGRDPVAFALIYLRKHLRDKRSKKISFARCHYEWAEMARTWTDGLNPEPQADRHAVIAPRETGKSTWWYLILPLWAAAYGHRTFVAAFANAASQAEQHLATFRSELENNAQLRSDFPELCGNAAGRRDHQADRAGLLHCGNGFIFAGRGIDSSVLGLKVDEKRPDLIVLDDIEPDEAKYSAELAKKRLGTVRDAILPMNVYASVVLVGTVTMPGSVVHQLVRVANGERDEELDWIFEDQFQPHWHRALYVDDAGAMQSLWPEKWPLEYLKKISTTRSYAKNFDNDPPDGDGAWWRREDVAYVEEKPALDRIVLMVDGAVTKKTKSDYTGLAVVGLALNAYRAGGRTEFDPRFHVLAASEVRAGGKELREIVLGMIERYEAQYVMVEANQGGDLWHVVFHDMPVRITTFTQSEPKEVRIRRLLAMYQRRVDEDQHVMLHAEPLPAYERRIMAYPHTDHDDVIDAVAAGAEHLVWMLLKAMGRTVTAAEVRRYAYANTEPQITHERQARRAIGSR
jgi:phage terminase large subunit-like protein